MRAQQCDVYHNKSLTRGIASPIILCKFVKLTVTSAGYRAAWRDGCSLTREIVDSLEGRSRYSLSIAIFQGGKIYPTGRTENGGIYAEDQDRHRSDRRPQGAGFAPTADRA